MTVVGMLGIARLSTAQTKPPKAVVEEFWKMDTEGGRLTAEGWRAADSFFVRPIAPPKDKILCVISYPFAVSYSRIQGNRAEVIVDTAGTVWKINPNMRLGVCSDQDKGFWLNKLVRTSKHWEFAPDHRTLREVGGPPEWRLEEETNYVYVTADIAIRYLMEVRDSTTNSVIKKNAEQSLATLRRHH
jgi:hypothetical protein